MSYLARRRAVNFGFSFIIHTQVMFKKILIQFALRLLKSQLLDKITYAPAVAFIGPAYDRLGKVAGIVTDKNPQDGEQLKELWEQEKHQFIFDTLESAKLIIQQEVKDQTIANIVLELLETIQEDQKALG